MISSRLTRYVGLSLIAALVMAACTGCGDKKKRLLFHAGVGQRSSLMDIQDLFEKKHPEAKLNFSFKGSGYFIGDVQRSKEGDLFMPGEEFYMLQAVERGLIEDYNPKTDIAAYFMVVIATPKGNPANVKSVEDFARPDVRVGLGNPKACAIGIWDQKIFKRAGIWEDVQANQVQSAKCIAEVLTGVQQKAVDATLMWASTAVLGLNDIEIIPLDPEYRGFVRLPVAVTSFSEHPKLARKLKQFILSENGEEVFMSHAYVTDPGPLDEEGFCTDGGAATEDDCRWLVNAAKAVKDKSMEVSRDTVGPLVREVKRQRRTERAGHFATPFEKKSSK